MVLQAGPDVVRLAPSLIIDEADIDEAGSFRERAIATLTGLINPARCRGIAPLPNESTLNER